MGRSNCSLVLVYSAVVRRATSHTPAATALPTAAKKAVERTTAAKYVAKLAEYVFHIHTAAAITTAICRLCVSRMAKLVIAFAFFSVAQHFVCFSRFLEVFFSLFIALVFIRVIFDRHLTIGFLDLVGIGTP